ncbi:SusC/RagA family TonB-linked outer membrane protein [Pinibacter soli]|uniref:TonB-dependent receptor n=1 Tax=Pinibacter soli TaxID=3044211 RepID=A0ABT6RAG2_9BACT|nr:TonB-dependent receptor [Pinibacter soli]MDI3319538.1 TonB-dependent receptor [Pinibacter soli]
MKSLHMGRLLLLSLFTLIYSAIYAQDGSISGQVLDETNQPVAFASVTIKGGTRGASADENGKFKILVPNGTYTVVVNAVGFLQNTQNVTVKGNDAAVHFALKRATTDLTEAVVIGYGTAKKKDLTGSVTAISSKDFQKGAISTPDQLISGRVAGVQISPDGGAPGGASTIRIRGGSSLNASNDPLFVIDGVPVDNPKKSDGTSSISGSPNPLSLINPNDIESINVLKDASATAIYGNRASNGVIIITTKKGKKGGPLRINFNTVNSVAVKVKNLDVLTADQFTKVVKDQAAIQNKPYAVDSLGKANTNWQNEIYHPAFTTDNNLSFSGGVKNLPYRLSLGYLHQDGILKTGHLERGSAALNLSPTFFDNHLRVDLNLKGVINGNRFANTGAVGDAIRMDPTKPVTVANSPYGGYYEWQDGGVPNTQSTRNPVADLYLKNDKATVYRSIGNLQLDYKFHFLPDLRANLNLGYDISNSDGLVRDAPNWAAVYTAGGKYHEYEQHTRNKLLDFYLNYTKDLKKIKSRIDVMAGYSYQDFLRGAPGFWTTSITKNNAGNPPTYTKPDSTQHTLVSFYGRLNYTYNNKYLLTATIRRDGSSRFSPDTRWGNFPSIALAWRISEEDFLKSSKTISNLKLRLGYGITGQQDITASDYPYLSSYSISTGTARYLLGDSAYYTYRGAPYDKNIKWETTTTSNIGLDFGLFKDRISGSLDVYYKKTNNLISDIPVAAGANLSNHVLTNVGNIENKGVEFVVNAIPVTNKDFQWNMGFNFTYNESKITKLSTVDDPSSPGVIVGGISGGTGNKIQIHSVGYAPFTFWVYKQVYDQTGKPIEGVYADVNQKGSGDLFYHYKSPAPKYMLGFNSQFSYKDWNLSFVLRSNIGNYVYNNVKSNRAAYSVVIDANKYLGNTIPDVLFTGFNNTQFYSDYYVENASFLRMDNLQVGYNFGKIGKNVNLRLSAIAQNLFVITKYTGIDPEIYSGIDNNIYPKTRIFSLGASVDF